MFFAERFFWPVRIKDSILIETKCDGKWIFIALSLFHSHTISDSDDGYFIYESSSIRRKHLKQDQLEGEKNTLITYIDVVKSSVKWKKKTRNDERRIKLQIEKKMCVPCIPLRYIHPFPIIAAPQLSLYINERSLSSLFTNILFQNLLISPDKNIHNFFFSHFLGDLLMMSRLWIACTQDSATQLDSTLFFWILLFFLFDESSHFISFLIWKKVKWLLPLPPLLFHNEWWISAKKLTANKKLEHDCVL